MTYPSCSDVGEGHLDLIPFVFGTPAELWGYTTFDEPARRAELEHQGRLWENADDQRRIEIAVRQSVLLEGFGRYGDAKRTLRERALPICEKRGDRQGRALLMLRVVNLERALGHPKKAFRLLQDEVLPGLGNIEARFRWQAEIARAELLQELGSLQAARRLVQKEIVPAVEAGGWQPEVAMARLLLAMMLLTTGERASAVRFVETKVDPVAPELEAAKLTASYQMLKVLLTEGENSLEEAILRIENNILPVLERRNELPSLARARASLAWRLEARNLPGDAARAKALMEQALATARDLKMPELKDWQELWNQPVGKSGS